MEFVESSWTFPDESRVAVGDIRNADVLAVPQSAREERCRCRSTLPSEAVRDPGEFLMKSMDPSRIEPAQVGELPLAVDGAEEASVPAPQIPIDGANEEGVTSTIPMSRDPGFRKGEGAGGLLGLTGLQSMQYNEK